MSDTSTPQQPPFDFRRYLRPQHTDRVIARHTIKHVPPVPGEDLSWMAPAGRPRAMHDALMEHTIDGYPKPWVRAVKDCVNATRAGKAPPYSHDCEQHWNAMHRAAHALIRDLLMFDHGRTPDPEFMPPATAVRSHWEEIYRHLDYFIREFPERTATTLPSYEEFVAALPSVCRQLIAQQPTERFSPEAEASELERLRHGPYVGVHTERVEAERAVPATDRQPGIEELEHVAQLSILSTLNPLNGGNWFDQVTHASTEHYEYLRERASMAGHTTSKALEAFDADIELFTESLRDYASAVVEDYLYGNKVVETAHAYGEFTAHYQKLLEQLPASARDTLPPSDMLSGIQPVIRSFVDDALKATGARPAEGRAR